MSNASPRVIVIGAGVIGAAAAYELGARGADVRVIDAGGARASDASFGWVNASFYQNETYFALRCAGIAAYRDLQCRLDVPLRWCGSLAWEFSGSELEAQYETLQVHGYPARLLERSEIAVLEPDLGHVPDRAIHFTHEAAVEPSALTQALLRASGAPVLRGVAVEDIVRQGARVTGVRTPVGTFEADHVLVAAGTGTQTLLAKAGAHVPLLPRPALVLRTAPVSAKLRHVLATDFGEVRQEPSGALTTPAAVGHQGDTAQVVRHPDDAAAQSMTRLRALFPALDVRLAEMQMAHRPVPQDGFPAVGPVAPGLYAAVMHSGITLAALMGTLIAQEMLDGTPAPLLDPYRPDRFASGS